MQLSGDLPSLRKRVAALYETGHFLDALPVASRALGLAHEAVDSRAILGATNDLAQLYWKVGRYKEAETFFSRVIDLSEAGRNPVSPSKEMLLHDLGKVYREQTDRYVDAERVMKQALAVGMGAQARDSEEIGHILHDLGDLYHQLARFDDEEKCLLDALTIYRKEGMEAEAATILVHLGGHRKEKGNYPEAEEFFKEALRLRQGAFGPRHTAVAQVLSCLASVRHGQWRFGDAEALYLQAVAIRRGSDERGLAPVLDNLGLVYHSEGRLEQASRCHEEAVKLYEKHSPGSPDLAIALHNLAWVYQEQGKAETAEAYYNHSLELAEAASAAESVASTLHNLGSLYFERGQFREAEERYRRSLSTKEQLHGPFHMEIATTTNNLALLYSDLGRLEEAKRLCTRSIEIIERNLGTDNASLAIPLSVLASIHLQNREFSEARGVLERALRLEESAIANVFAFASESEKLNYLANTQALSVFFVNLIAQEFSDEPGAVRNALDVVLRRKGIVLETLALERRAIERANDSETLKIAAKLRNAIDQLSDLSVKGQAESTRKEYEQKLETLNTEKQALEKHLATMSGVHGAQLSSRGSSVKEVARSLPLGKPLIEYVLLPSVPLKWRSQDLVVAADRYIAFVLQSSTEVARESAFLVDLGQADTIDSAIRLFRQDLRAYAKGPENPARTDSSEDKKPFSTYCRQLHQLLWEPIARHLQSPDAVFLSTDGEINQLPFGALADGEGGYLIEQLQLNYLSTGRDLSRFGKSLRNTGDTLIVADPNYDLGLVELARQLIGGNFVRPGGDSSCGATTDLKAIRWKRLPGTREEARSIEKVLGPNTKTYVGKKATKALLKSLESPKRLHIATHGFFLDDIGTPRSTLPMPRLTSGPPIPAFRYNPLLRSGLLLAGANHPSISTRNTDNGILTAMEASGLHLSGTDLTVLSACETGVGQNSRGEGVFGLRRAFELAGVSTIVMSLWNISDEATAILMKDYYARIQSGEGKGPALRNAQLSFLQNSPYRHPYYWAAFVSVGES